MVAQPLWNKKLYVGAGILCSWTYLLLRRKFLIFLKYHFKADFHAVYWCGEGLVFSVSSDDQHLKATNQRCVIFPDLYGTRILAWISSRISGILKQAHWEYLRTVSTEVLALCVPAQMLGAVGHLFPHCDWRWPMWPPGETGWKTQSQLYSHKFMLLE